LKADANFRRFWLGQAVSTTGDAFALVAMPLLVLETTGSVAHMGGVTACGCAGQIAMSLAAGVIVDRAHRRSLMIACDVARAVLYAAPPLAWWLGAPSLVLLYVVAGLGAALGNLFQVGYVAAVANIVPKSDLALANGRLYATAALTYAAGPMLAGAVCARFGPAMALAFDAASFLVSAISLATVRFGQERAERDANTHGGGALAEVLVGLRFLARQPALRALVATMASVGLLGSAGVTAAVIDLFVFHLRSDLAQNSHVVGLCLGLSALGALAGAVVAPRLHRSLGFGACFLGGTALQALGLATAGAFAGVGATMAGATLWAGGQTLRAVVAISLRQELTPDPLLGRVTAATWTMIFGAGAIGALAVTRLAGALGTSHALLVLGAALALVVGVASATPMASQQRAAAAAPPSVG
jgi:MFS family permease